jgi:Predicted ATPase (AAA+ superfamily)
LPFDADALYQLQSAAQLRRAVRYYESRILTECDSDRSHFVILDDVHRVEHPNKPTIDGWGSPVTELLEDPPDRHVVVTASAGVQIERELQRVGMASAEYDIQPVLPEKFRDYLFALYPDMEAEENRVSPTSVRTGENSLPAALRTEEIQPFVEELRQKYETVADVRRQVQSQVVEYLTMGGVIAYDVEGTPASATELISADYAALRENVRRALYREVPGFESIKTIADLERLCALAARDCGGDPLQYQELVDLFDVDRRTITDSYLPALSKLYLLTGATEYDNSRPRAVRLYLRDTGLVTALTGTDSPSIRGDLDREADLARVAAFDHTMRFAYTVNVTQGRDAAPSVQYWRGSDGKVDFVFELDGTPVPLGLAYRPNQREESLAAIREFLRQYDSPVGILLTGDTVQQGEPITDLGDGVIQLPYWLYLLLC